MTKLPLYDVSGKSSGEVTATKEVFGREINEHVVHSALVWYLAAKRRGTQSAKTRAEVRGGGKKPWKQKGTGRARAGSIRSPLWRTGGVIFAPKPRSYNYSLPKKVKKQALAMVLSDKAQSEKVKIVDEFKLAEAKTKLAAKLLKDLGVSGKTLFVLGQQNDDFVKAARNLAGASVALFKDLNVHELMSAEWIVMEKKALTGLKEFLA
ncbi:MAG: 50S ribosomal protein L4 [Candidatus Margulisiibacteriota bacterium]